MLKMRTRFQLVTPNDIEVLAERCRRADKEELIAASGGNAPLAVLTESVMRSRLSYAAYLPAGLVAIFGVVGDIGEPGQVWFIGTDLIEKHPVEFVKLGKIWFDQFHREHDVLWNWIDTRNHVHMTWLKYMGCEFHEKTQFGGTTFVRFTHTRTSTPRNRKRQELCASHLQ